MTDLDVCRGELYLFPEEDRETLYEYCGLKRNGSYLFLKQKDERKRSIPAAKFREMRGDGRAVRVSTAALAQGAAAGDLDPFALLDPDEAGLSVRERETRRKASERMMEARTLRFYVIRHDEEPETKKRGTTSLARFIERNHEDALAYGLTWKPSPSAVRRALDRYGTPGDRPLSAFLDRGKHELGERWHEATLRLKAEMVAYYWSEKKPRITDAQAFFYGRFKEEKADREAKGERPLVRPTKEVLRLWIHGAESWANWRRREGERSANRRFRGRGRAVEASRILEYVIFDHTRVDTWAKVLDEDGQTIIVERPWLTLAIDVYSRMILGAVLTFEPASLHSVMLCLRQVVRPKRFLEQEFGEAKGATDGWGKPGTVIVDNGWEFVGVSFQVCCEAAGVHVIWAPVKNPEFKTYVERAFETYNEHLFHRIPGGIPHKPHEMAQLGLRPELEAEFDIDEMEDRFWRVTVTLYHVEVHNGIGMAPARAWKSALARSGRKTIDDIASLDKVLGKSVRCLLTAEGIHYGGHRFHDTRITSQLLDDLLRYGKIREQRKGKLQTGKVWVLVTIDEGSCEFVHVWNPRRKLNQRLSNWDRRFAQGCSWGDARRAKQFAERENLAFHTDEEKWTARWKFQQSLVPSMTEGPYRERRKLVRAYKPARPRLDGDTVVTTFAEPSAMGMNTDIPAGLPVREREDDRIPAKAPRRGGAKATRKAAATRARNAARKSERNNAAPRDSSPVTAAPTRKVSSTTRNAKLFPETCREHEVADAPGLLASLAADLD